MRKFPRSFLSLRMAVFVFSVFGVGKQCFAQQYHWHVSLPGRPWSAVAFNPQSNGRILFAGSLGDDSIYRSDDGGHTWRGLSNGSPALFNSVRQIFCLPNDTNIVVAVTPNDFYRSSDGGRTWYDNIFNGGALQLGGIDGESIGYNVEEGAIYYGENFAVGVFRSDDLGLTWGKTGTGNPDSIGLCAMDVSQGEPTLLIQGSQLDSGCLARSLDSGMHWAVTFHGRSGEDVEVPKVVFSWNAVDPASGLHSIAIATRWPTNDSSMVATTDGGQTWSILHNAPFRCWSLDIDQRASMLSKPGDAAYPMPLHFFTGLFDVKADTVKNSLVQETTDGGRTWHSTNFPVGVPGDLTNPRAREIWVLKYDTVSGRLAAATDSGIFITDPVNSVGPSPSERGQDEVHFFQDPNGLTVTSLEPMESLRMFDLLGHQVFQSSRGEQFFRIESSHYRHGAYAIEIEFGNRSPVRKLILFR